MAIDAKGKTKRSSQDEPAMDGADRPEKRVSVWVKLFVLFHIISIVSWSLPPPAPAIANGSRKLELDTRSGPGFARSAGSIVSDGLLLVNQKYVKTSPVRLYALTTGFWQYWDMFAPNPAHTDFYGTAEIEYRDGTKAHYAYPRVYSFAIPVKYFKERYRKYYERAHLESNNYLWPSFAQRIAAKNYFDQNNPPVKVKLVRHWLPISPPGEPEKTTYNTYEYYTHAVDQAQLEKAGLAR